MLHSYFINIISSIQNRPLQNFQSSIVQIQIIILFNDLINYYSTKLTLQQPVAVNFKEPVAP